ncbi:NUDIX domain-containing protein [Streptomyces sp. MBT70]|nr:NUDIX domain-containing protein [Streptomyces sp. MBT70]
MLEPNKTPKAGVAREVLEETGIHVEVDELTGVYKNLTHGIVTPVFRCKPSGGTDGTLFRNAPGFRSHYEPPLSALLRPDWRARLMPCIDLSIPFRDARISLI